MMEHFSSYVIMIFYAYVINNICTTQTTNMKQFGLHLLVFDIGFLKRANLLCFITPVPLLYRVSGS